MSEKEIIKDRPKEKKKAKKAKGEHEPDPSKACEFFEMIRKSETESEIVHCDIIADYRVLEYSDRRYLVDGGDPQDSKSYKALMNEIYYCKKHFDMKYKYTPVTPTMTFVKIDRTTEKEEEQ